ncbi:methyl-accepting chemotaxis protein [Brachyspira suanatina]|uniref:Methyl-accepting chemotaxis protein n=1 Tax=Brachyspira suanatina TaxID=381802 RepID=A0A0G4K513_9SPIR|nr:methyl-accepting chemotaxis protein [Brachyspira suanatina]CRF32400.1 methyl-accepting chemotaxis protein [Brachyspira suanatina]
MKKLNSLAFKMPLSISCISSIIIIVLLVISLFFSSKGITESINVGFRNTVEGYAYLLDALTEAQMLLANSYASDANIRNYMIFRDDVYSVYSGRDMTNFIEKNSYVESLYLTDINGNVLLTTSEALRNRNMADIRPDLWRKLSTGEKVAFGSPRESPVSGEITLGVGSIVTDFTNNTIGYLVSTIKGSVIHDNYFSKVRLGRTGRIVAVNENFIVTMDMDPANINKPAPEAYKNIFNNASDEGPYSYKNGNILRIGYYKKMDVQPWIVTYAMNEDEIFEQIRTTVFVSILVAVLSIIALVIFMFMYARRITKPLRIVVEEAKEIEEGRLIMHGRKINRNDEIGELSRSFHNMKYKLIDIIETSLNESSRMAQAANSLATGNKDLAEKAESTAGNLEETGSFMEEIAAAITVSINNSVKGNEMMNDCKIAIENAASVVEETVKSISEVNADSEKIKNIIKVIEGIAFQTNILALNAAVEAARAGDQGKGFAVVASEVRSLAQSSQDSAKDITELINQVYEKINRANQIVGSQEQLFVGIKEQIEETADTIKSITEAAVEQKEGVAQVNRAVEEMDTLTQENAALVEESTASSMSLYDDARHLKEVINFFSIEK